jgi:hypothetical protein
MRQERVWTAALVLALLPAGAQATPPIGGNTLSFGAGDDVGASADTVYSVALGDLDVVSGSNTGADYEV